MLGLKVTLGMILVYCVLRQLSLDCICTCSGFLWELCTAYVFALHICWIPCVAAAEPLKILQPDAKGKSNADFFFFCFLTKAQPINTVPGVSVPKMTFHKRGSLSCFARYINPVCEPVSFITHINPHTLWKDFSIPSSFCSLPVSPCQAYLWSIKEKRDDLRITFPIISICIGPTAIQG